MRSNPSCAKQGIFANAVGGYACIVQHLEALWFMMSCTVLCTNERRAYCQKEPRVSLKKKRFDVAMVEPGSYSLSSR